MEEGGSWGCCVDDSVEDGVVVVVVDGCDGWGVGGVTDDSRLFRKSRSSASACSSRVKCRVGLGSGCDGVDGC